MVTPAVVVFTVAGGTFVTRALEKLSMRERAAIDLTSTSRKALTPSNRSQDSCFLWAGTVMAASGANAEQTEPTQSRLLRGFIPEFLSRRRGPRRRQNDIIWFRPLVMELAINRLELAS